MRKCIYWDKNKKAYIDTKIKVDGVFKHFSAYGYETKADADRDFERAVAHFIRNNAKSSSIMLVDDLINEYRKYRKLCFAILTAREDESFYSKYFFPFFKKKMIKDVLNVSSMRQWYEKILDLETSQARKSKIVTKMRDLLEFSFKRQLISADNYNLIESYLYPIKVAKRPSKEKRAWTYDELAQFLEATKAEPVDWVMFKLFFVVSGRLAEFQALTPGKFDREQKTITIDAQILEGAGVGSWIHEDILKTSVSYRIIQIDDETCEMLSKYIDTLGLSENDFLFGKHKSPISKHAFRNRMYRYIEVSKVPFMTPHGCRHTMATMMRDECENAADITAAAKRLGHSPSTFMNTYAMHNTEDREKEIMKRMSNREKTLEKNKPFRN